MALPRLRCGSLSSEPLLVMVVKPLKARMPSAVAPRKPVSDAPLPAAEKSVVTESDHAEQDDSADLDETEQRGHPLDQTRDG